MLRYPEYALIFILIELPELYPAVAAGLQAYRGLVGLDPAQAIVTSGRHKRYRLMASWLTNDRFYYQPFSYDKHHDDGFR